MVRLSTSNRLELKSKWNKINVVFTYHIRELELLTMFSYLLCKMESGIEIRIVGRLQFGNEECETHFQLDWE